MRRTAYADAIDPLRCELAGYPMKPGIQQSQYDAVVSELEWERKAHSAAKQLLAEYRFAESKATPADDNLALAQDRIVELETDLLNVVTALARAREAFEPLGNMLHVVGTAPHFERVTLAALDAIPRVQAALGDFVEEADLQRRKWQSDGLDIAVAIVRGDDEDDDGSERANGLVFTKPVVELLETRARELREGK